MRAFGVLLIIFGVVALAYGGIHYTQREKVLQVGSAEVHVEHRKTVPLSPLAGAVALIAGVVLVTRRSSMV